MPGNARKGKKCNNGNLPQLMKRLSVSIRLSGNIWLYPKESLKIIFADAKLSYLPFYLHKSLEMT